MHLQARVVHRYFGTGFVSEVRLGGHYCLVRFVGLGVELWVPTDELTQVTEGQPAVTPQPPRPTRRRPESVRVTRSGGVSFAPYRRLIEALRLGIVPEAFVSEFTFGRERERDVILTRLERAAGEGRGGAFIVEDEYGKGKTHFLSYLRAEALKRGYAVSMVAFDPMEVTPFRVKRVYAELVRTLMWLAEGRVMGFRDLVGAPRATLPEPHPYLTPFFALRDSHRLREHHWQWLEGDRHLNRRFMYLPTLLEDYVASNLYCNLLTTLASLLGQAGARGWVLLFDESESLGAVQFSQWRHKGANFLKGLVLSALDRTAEEPLKLENGHAWGQTVYRNPVNGLIYSRRRREVLPYRHRPAEGQAPPCIFPVFAFTPVQSDYHDEIAHLVPREQIVALPELGRREAAELFTALSRGYREVYGFAVHEEDLGYLLDTLATRFGYNVRALVKAMVELLDLMRLHPERSLRHFLAHG
jgi:hypothetical protein